MYYYKTTLFEKMLTDLAVANKKEEKSFHGNPFLMLYKNKLERKEEIPPQWQKTLDFMEKRFGKFRNFSRKKPAVATAIMRKIAPLVKKYYLLVEAEEKVKEAVEKSDNQEDKKRLEELKEKLQKVREELENEENEQIDTPYDSELQKMIKKLEKGEIPTDLTTNTTVSVVDEKAVEKIEKKIETLKKAGGIEKASVEEDVMIGLIYDIVNDTTLEYLGEMLENVGKKTKQLEVDPTAIDYGNDIDRIRIESVFDELMFEQRLAEDNLVIKGLEEEVEVGYGTFVMCVDSSASMSWKNIEKAKALALFYGMQSLRKGIDFVLITFNSHAEKLGTYTSRRDIVKLIESVSKINARGGTDYNEAIELAEKEAKKLRKKADLLFISDGEPAYGPDNAINPEVFEERVFVGVNARLDSSWENYFTRKFFVSDEDFHVATATDIENLKSLGGVKP